MQGTAILSNRIKQVFLYCIAVLLIVSCGIENMVYLYPPARTYDNSDLTDASKRYCEFRTADSDNTAASAEYFQGTEIYYRIYERESDCTSAKNEIERYNDSNPSNAAQYLQDTKKYHRLRCSNVSAGQRPLIVKSASNTIIRFRLENYGTPGPDFEPAQLTVGGTSLGIPHRDSKISDDKKEFSDNRIAVGDDDVQQASAAVSESHWYVNFYAVSYGYDKTFRTLYSALAPLGFIRIDKSP